MKKFIILFVILAFLSLSSEELYGEDNSFPLKITDMAGRAIILENLPQRIISLSPSSTELLFYLGLSQRVIGVSSDCNYPPQALKKCHIGDINISLEKLIELQPDLIVAEKGLWDDLAYQCEPLGLPMIFLNSTNIEGIYSSILLLGEATGEVEVSCQLVNSLEKEILFLQQKISDSSLKSPPKVFVEIWNEPLMTVGNKSFINDIISLSGGQNIAGDINRDIIPISNEWVLERDPELIIVTTPGHKETVLSRPAWQDIYAIKNYNVYEVDPDIFVRPTPRVIIAMRQLAYYLNSGN